ncbi:sensor domain-containing phosphodiesterase [Aurantiacibacter poecillastricola]|uniref:sensor domain-containing phosphodiesterase n=1 Tax=Aurantiacibacter poecillastricola TaxID=3064385 RepID=UPI00273D79BC|nr:EAL domain-containing protein [Aurantiacibacter sp. 219JJ12-13]MDP5261085.1 EAL domain-containing protein [Aurantiacibacter sp. 219JJ12-13]
MGNAALQLPDFATAPARSLSKELVNDPGIERILSAVRGHLGVEIAFVSRYVENDQRELTHVSTDLDLPMGPGFREDREDSYCWHILHGRLPELIQDPADHPLTQKLGITDFLPVGCHINTPLRLADGTVWGSFCALGRKPDRSMNPRDLEILKSFAGLACERIETSLENDISLQHARERVKAMLDGHAVTIFQQPIHDLKTGNPVGVECLARFPDLTKRGPQAWFEDAERTGLGIDLEMTAVRCALETVSQVPEGVYAAINASPSTILSGQLRAALENAQTSELVIEITEHQQVADFRILAREIAALKPFARIAIDDVGTGYAGLRHLIELQPDILKMDMVLTRHIDRDPARRAISAAMVQFAHDIDAVLVAEGIETEAERNVMQDLGVDYGQGYHFARPLPVVAAQQHLLGVGRDLG